MRKQMLLRAGIVLLALACALCLLLPRAGKRPFRKLDASEIAAASVRLTPPDVTVELDGEQCARLAELLRAVVICQADDSWHDYDGQGVTYTITKTDGTALTVTAYNPFVIIDGQGYRTKYAPCEALNAFGNRLNYH